MAKKSCPISTTMPESSEHQPTVNDVFRFASYLEPANPRRCHDPVRPPESHVCDKTNKCATPLPSRDGDARRSLLAERCRRHALGAVRRFAAAEHHFHLRFKWI